LEKKLDLKSCIYRLSCPNHVGSFLLLTLLIENCENSSGFLRALPGAGKIHNGKSGKWEYECHSSKSAGTYDFNCSIQLLLRFLLFC